MFHFFWVFMLTIREIFRAFALPDDSSFEGNSDSGHQNDSHCSTMQQHMFFVANEQTKEQETANEREKSLLNAAQSR